MSRTRAGPNSFHYNCRSESQTPRCASPSSPLATLRETPAEAEIASHRLMLRSGMVRRLASGLFTWMPLGWRVARIVERVTRQEMERIGRPTRY